MTMKTLLPVERIERRIYLIRGHKVMLDRDLAELYGVKPIVLRQQVKRNRGRFPKDFLFRLTGEEADILVSQFVIPSRKHLRGHLPYVFTREGVGMLSSVLRSPKAIHVNIAIMRVFADLGRMLASNKEFADKFAELERDIATLNEDVLTLFEAVRLLLEPLRKPKNKARFDPRSEGMRRIQAGRVGL